MSYLSSAAICVVLLLAGVGSASADVFGPIGLISTSAREQAGFAHDAAISGDGRYVAFDGVFAGKHGVWRRDLQSGAVVVVAEGDGALPSISEDGQYVSFTTTARLAPNDDINEAPDVYVRNMGLEGSSQEAPACEAEELDLTPGGHGQSCPFVLVSAVNGKAEGLDYEGSGPSRLGAVASGRTGISGDGRHVVFVTTAVSNLIDPVARTTPAMQVAVRDLESEQTQLVSVREDPETGTPAVNPETGGPEAVTGREGFDGAVYSDGGEAPPPFKGPEPYALTPPLGASISADGSTVAWLGVNIAEQAKVLPGETLKDRYTEPLWRRIGEGPRTPTRRITGGSDPESPACIADGEQLLAETSSNPCQGPFYVGAGTENEPGIWKAGGTENFVPQLSADGYTVAFLAQAPTLARTEGFASSLRNTDLYVANMHPGLTRTAALQPLTELASGSESDLATTGSIVDFGLSPDGKQVAFSTQRTQFPLGVPAYVSTPMAIPGMSELFDVDLADSTLTRVTEGFEGGPGEYPHQETGSGTSPYGLGDGALSPSFSDSGDLLAFASTAANLVYGDGNTPPLVEGQLKRTEFDGSDAFLISRIPFLPTPTETYVSGPPDELPSAPEWRLGVTAATLANGHLRLYVTVPAAGRISANAKSVVRIERVSRATKASAHHSARHAHKATVLVTKGVAATSRLVPSGSGMVQLTLTLTAPYKRLASTGNGLPATVTVQFAAAGHHALSQTITASFKRRGKAAKKHEPRRRVKR